MSSGPIRKAEEKAPAESRSKTKNSIGRGIFAAASMILQVIWITLMVTFFKNHYALINWIVQLSVFVMVLYIYMRRENTAFKLPWIMLILTFPILGVTMYAFVQSSSSMKRMKRRFAEIDKDLLPMLPDSSKMIDGLEEKDPVFANMARSIQEHGAEPKGFPLYHNTKVEYYADALDALAAQVEELRKAEKFILMEYHAIEDGEGFREIHEILKAKVKAGVEVHLIYDDLGSIGFVDRKWRDQLVAEGIDTRVFNPVVPILEIFQNNRDHRKITVIDGKVGFTGGYNLADEYFHFKEPYGWWKDSGVKLTGDAVTTLTVMFMEMWNSIAPSCDHSIGRYFPKIAWDTGEESYVQPYADSPMDDVMTGENVYMNLINAAQHYIWFTTPYLVITDELKRMLILTAQRGVDVRIITPGIPDKKLIYNVTRSYYDELADGGVRIFEFTPGFIHTKDCICDGIYATCGTVNLDYRSFYHHFEDGVLLYRSDAIAKIREDFEETFPQCREVTEEYKGTHRFTLLRLWRSILRLFAALM